MDNPETQTQDNPETQDTQQPQETQQTNTAPSWKTGLEADLKNSPLVQKFEDTPQGLNEAIKSHASLEQLLGHEKVPIPKGPEDVEGWNRFSKAMGIPDKAEGYGLPDAQLPDSMKGMTIDKNQFAEIAHAHKLTPSQVKGLWETYVKLNIDNYNKAMETHQNTLNDTVNRLKSEWGDTYDNNVELGQMVINRFSADQETNDWLTSVFTSDPRGVKFLAKIGEQFAENKIGEFSMKRFSLSPEQAQSEIDEITRDPKHPYNNPDAPQAEHQRAVDYVNNLYVILNKSKGQA